MWEVREVVQVSCRYQFSVSVTLSYIHSNHSLSPSRPTNGSNVHMHVYIPRERRGNGGRSKKVLQDGAVAIELDEVSFSRPLEGASGVGTLEPSHRICLGSKSGRLVSSFGGAGYRLSSPPPKGRRQVRGAGRGGGSGSNRHPCLPGASSPPLLLCHQLQPLACSVSPFTQTILSVVCGVTGTVPGATCTEVHEAGLGSGHGSTLSPL